MNGTQFHSGKIIAAWIPRETNSVLAFRMTNIWLLSTCMDPTLLSAGTQEGVTIKMPYVSPNQFDVVSDATGNFGYFSTLSLRVLNPLQMIGAASTVTIKINVFMKFVDVEYAGPNVAVYQGKEADTKSESHLISSGLDLASRVVSKVTSTGVLGPEGAIGGAIVSAGLSGAAWAARKNGLGKPQSSEAPTLTHVKSYDMSFGDGIAQGYSLTNRTDNAVDTGPNVFGDNPNKNDLKWKAQQPALIDVFSFDMSKAKDYVLKTYHVRPSLCATYTKITGTNLNNEYVCYMSPLFAISQLFKYWRGSIKFSLDFTASKFCTTRLRLIYFPDIATLPAIGASVTDETAGNLIHMVFDVVGDTVINFEVPYLQTKLYQYTRAMGGSVSSGGNIFWDEYCNGGIALCVVNPIICNTQTTSDSKIYCNTFVAGGEDIAFHTLRSSFKYGMEDWTTKVPVFRWYDYPVIPDPAIYTVFSQGGELGDAHSITERFSKPFPPIVACKKMTLSNLCDGDYVQNLKQITNRFSWHTKSDFDSSTKTKIIQFYDLIDQTKDDPKNLFDTWAMYRKGSINITLTNAVKSSNSAISYGSFQMYNIDVYPTAGIFTGASGPQDTYNDYARNGMAYQFMGATDQNIQFKVPFAGRVAYVGTNKVNLPATEAFEEFASVLRWVQNNSTSACGVDIWWATGEDFDWGWYCGCPALIVSLTAHPAVQGGKLPIVDNNDEMTFSLKTDLVFEDGRHMRQTSVGTKK